MQGLLESRIPLQRHRGAEEARGADRVCLSGSAGAAGRRAGPGVAGFLEAAGVGANPGEVSAAPVFPSKVWITITPDEAQWLKEERTDIATGLVWDRILSRFEKDPDGTVPGFESPATTAYPMEVYPSFFIDDPANPLTIGDVRTGTGGLFRPQGQEESPSRFGNAVANAVDLFRHIDGRFPNWNLDGDRGLAWFTWQFKGGKYDPDGVQAEPEA